MKVLTEAEVIRVFKEEHHKRVEALKEELDMYFKGGSDTENVISPELKVKHKKSGIRYTVDSVSTRDIVLRSPEGERCKVNQQTLEDEFEID